MNTLYLAYFILLYGGTFAALALAFKQRNGRWAGVLTTVFVMAFCWTLLETVSAIRLTLFSGKGDAGFVMEGEASEIDSQTLQHRFKQRDADLGYGPRPGFAGRSAKRVGDQYAFDVHYRINADGSRNTPGSVDTAPETHLFLGDSQTFGMGVNDAETYASVYAKALSAPRVLNYSFVGWGPQQALEILRLRAPKLAGGSRLTEVYFMVCCGHDQRFAGLSTWESEKIVFRLDGSGQLVYGGVQRGSAISPWLNRLFTVKLLRDLITGWRLRTQPQSARDALLREGLIEMKRRAEALGARFTLIAHRGAPATRLPLDVEGLSRAGVEIVDVSSLMSAGLYAKGDFLPLDPHPNPAWHRAVGEGLAARIRDTRPPAPRW